MCVSEDSVPASGVAPQGRRAVTSARLGSLMLAALTACAQMLLLGHLCSPRLAAGAEEHAQGVEVPRAHTECSEEELAVTSENQAQHSQPAVDTEPCRYTPFLFDFWLKNHLLSCFQAPSLQLQGKKTLAIFLSRAIQGSLGIASGVRGLGRNKKHHQSSNFG